MEIESFKINGFFNNLPIRIIGSPSEPFFYAIDICDVLGLKQISVAIKNFDDMELVSYETRIKYNLITYKKYKDKLRRDDTVILLTEFGVYRLILCSHSNRVKEFKQYIYQLIKNARGNEIERLHVMSHNDIKSLNDRLKLLELSQADYQKYNPAIHVFSKKINDNPYKYIPANIIDNEIADMSDNTCDTLYKFTIRPTAEDFTQLTFYAKIYGDSEQIMGELLEGSLEILPIGLKYYRYHNNFDFDINCGRIIYQ